MGDWGSTLRGLETLLRSRGLTGSQAFDVLLPALEAWTAGSAGEGVDAQVLGMLEAGTRPGRGDVLGLAYEVFFPDLYKGSRGQYFTPPTLGALLWSRLPVTPGTVVLDPTCGSGGLLVHAVGTGASLRGLDIDARLVRLARTNLALLGCAVDVRRADFFVEPPEPVDVVVANPPFSVSLTEVDLLRKHRALAGPRGVSSDVVFLAQVHDWVRPGGRAGVIVPWSVVANPSSRALREHLGRRFQVDAVLALPEGVFRPFGGAAGRAAMVWLTRDRTQRVATCGPWYRSLGDPGWDVRSRHLRRTDDRDVEAALRGEGFQRIEPGQWVPSEPVGLGVELQQLASVVTERGRRPTSADLSDLEPVTGELRPRAAERARRLPLVAPGDVVFSRLRPELGVVGVHAGNEVIAASAEWIVLRPSAHPRWLRHALRTPRFRRGLPTTGQTRPRTTLEAVRQAVVPTPSPAVRAIVDRVSLALSERLRVAAEGLSAVQDAVDAHAAGTLDDAGLARAVERLADPPATGGSGPRRGTKAGESP